MQEHLEIKRVGVVLRPSTPELKALFYQVKNIFEHYGAEVLIDSISAGMIGVLGQDFSAICEKSDILVCIGGDGTLISLTRRSYQFHKPILGINAGTLGFLADINPSEIETFVEKLYNGEFRIDERMMIEAVLSTGEEEKHLYSFNDIVISRPSISKMVKVDAYIDKRWFNTYFGDGLIISTPTGSTAYNLAAGGPVTFPLTDAFILTPICPHSLTQRPLVIPANFEIEIKTPEKESLVIIDGQEQYDFGPEDTLLVKKASIGARLIHRVERNYFDVLREKLSWGQVR
ncbi:NAD(+)/NADH kinase [Hydrogenimonas sp.]|uniref:NAD(+)/NADH kinase n=1 Tax=Hydrogenimonas sp. TaxID=2231112 RepID=UPI0026326521|nr:NAD(+)/NADH kinase [Hydrogenimonas sp.]